MTDCAISQIMLDFVAVQFFWFCFCIFSGKKCRDKRTNGVKCLLGLQIATYY